uniref:Leucine-rich repeat transmembrane neuronal protein 1-like n=1 Tax=Phallusia mammillata TaxID=59560 RepID=A0A6F9DJB8_9ASCI|nr:leucine-rich repeat transmembrane neuronal protein 1-like [Phallusia mammillata]
MQQLNVDGNPVCSDNIKLQAEVVEYTTVTLLDGVNIGSLKDQFSALPMSKPPPADEPLKSTLKQAVREAMWHNLKAQEKKHNSNLRYMHKKLLNMLVDMDEFREQTEVDTEAWCSYIDTLSAEELNGLSVSKIRALALAAPDGSIMGIDDKIARKRPPRKK